MAKTQEFNAQVTIAAPPQAVWPWLVDDERRARWQNGIVSRIAPDAVATISFGRFLRARHTIVEWRPNELLVEELDSSNSRERDHYRLTPVEQGTLVEFTAEAEVKKLEAIKPPLPSQTETMNRVVAAGMLRLRNLVEAEAGRPRHASAFGDDAVDSNLGAVLKSSDKAMAKRGPQVAATWNAMQPSRRARALISANASFNAHDPYEAQMALHLADDMRKKFGVGSLVVKLALLAFFIAAAWYDSPLRDGDFGIFSIGLTIAFSWLAWLTLAIITAFPRQRRTAAAAIALNASYLERVAQVEQAIAYTDHASGEQRIAALHSFATLPAEGSLNWLVESVLSRYLRSQEPGVAAVAAQSLRHRRARLLDAVERRLTPDELLGDTPEAALQRHTAQAIVA